MTGDVKGFAASDWQPALTGGVPVDFETEGELIVSALSANSLGFDSAGNLHVGGSNFFGGGDSNFFALVASDAVDGALAGLGPVDETDPLAYVELDPDPLGDTSGAGYRVAFNPATSELIAASNGTGFVLAVPEPTAAVLLVMAASVLAAGRK
ncbi:MAG: hypothetical protein AAF236_01000 [Verrucomicrobiota bacterium]